MEAIANRDDAMREALEFENEFLAQEEGVHEVQPIKTD
jgi:hypothetical protein